MQASRIIVNSNFKLPEKGISACSRVFYVFLNNDQKRNQVIKIIQKNALNNTLESPLITLMLLVLLSIPNTNSGGIRGGGGRGQDYGGAGG